MNRLNLPLLVLLCWLLQLPAGYAGAQSPEPYLVYIWQNQITARPLNGGTPQNLGEPFTDAPQALPEDALDVYSHSPVEGMPEGYGFHHGVWSADRARLAYIALQSGSYRLLLWEGGETRLLVEGTLSTGNGFPDPLGWTNDHTLLVIERLSLHTLNGIHITQINTQTGEQTPLNNFLLPELTGRSALLPDGNSAFIGFDIEGDTGYTYDFALRRVFTFSERFVQPELPKSIFQTFPAPVAVLGIVEDLAGFQSRLAQARQTQVITEPVRPAPFLHWPLADSHRTLTCYPDSNWTRANFAFTCPGIPRDYDGHQGTDVGGRPDGLPLNTPVYPSLPGLVVMRYDACDASSDMNCGGAYGNVVMLEHIVVVEGEAQSWFTGYAHLTEPLVQRLVYMDDLTQPLGLSGDTGVGGPHLHFEVRERNTIGVHRWVDPWGAYYPPHEDSLWLDGNEKPRAINAG
ncbi:MAG: hypothetical protein OHK0046_46660 [Anaerolineae bacterium]